jgi:hypothetical protein
MPWTVTDPERLRELIEAGPPPNDLHTLVHDLKWGGFFLNWASAAKADGDPQPLGLLELESCFSVNLELNQFYDRFFVDNPEFPVQLPMGLKLKAKQVQEGRNDGYSWSDLQAEFERHLMDEIIRYAGPFMTDVKRIQDEDAAAKAAQEKADTVGNLTMQDITLDDVYQANHDAQKDLQKGQSVDFIQSGTIVLVGKKHDPAYYLVLADQPDVCRGTLTMVSKGGAFGAGEIRVAGSNDPAKFKEGIRDFSKKKIVFV